MIKLKAPTILVLMLTGRCNLKCIFCATSNLTECEVSNELTTLQWIDILNQIAKLKVCYLIITGGEIFLKEDIFDILEVACDLFPNRIKINTNGTLLSEEQVEKLSNLDFNILVTSIDGSEITHDKIRGKGNYAKTITFIKQLVERDMKFEVCFVPTKINYKDFPVVIDELVKIGVRQFHYNTLSPEGRSCENFQELQLSYPDEQKEFVDIIQSINKQYLLNIPYKYNMYLEFENNYKKIVESGLLKKLKPNSIWQCSAGTSSCAILPEGHLIPCSPFDNFKSKSLKEITFEEAWNTADWGEICSLSKVVTSDIPECRNCKYNIICGAGCRGINYQKTGNLLAADVNCPFIKR